MEKKFKGTKNLKVLTVGGIVIGVGTDDEVSKVTCNSILPDTDEEYEKEREVIEADMMLYAAAPDLLEALEDLLDELSGQSLESSTSLYIQKAKEAINKALD